MTATEREPLLERLPRRPNIVYAGEPHTPEWHAARQRGIGGSDVAAALGLDRFRSPLEVYLEKTAPTALPLEDAGEPAAWGNRLEPVVASWAARELGAELHPWPAILAHAEHPWIRASLDRLVDDVVDGLRVLEVKVTRWDADWSTDQLPQRVEAQARWYLLVTGLSEAVVAALIHGTRGELRRVYRDEAIENYLLEHAAAFWQRVEQRNPPELGGAEIAAGERLAKALRRTSSVEGLAVDLGEEWHDRLDERRFLRAELGEIEQDLGRIENQLRVAMGEAETAYLDGEVAATNKAQTARKVDLRAFAAELPEVAEHYRKPATTRVLRVKEQPENGD